MTASTGAARGAPPDAAGEASEVAPDGLVRALPDVLASKIAAGEVVQRPASVVKELLENAIDAGARRVDLVVKRAGSALVQVVDDGGGMGPADAEACFGRHATSKLRAFDDLERLATLGFRGEALASIAAVARVELRTRRAQDAAGTCIRVEGGRVVESAPCAAEAGTSIAVRDLFYNVPARRAFLKAPATEFKHIVDAFQSVALSEPQVAFSLSHDGVDVYRLPAPAADASFETALAQRVAGLFGTAEEALVPVGESTSYLSLRGYVGRPENARRGKTDAFLFVNGRVIRHRGLEYAVLQSYGGLIPEGRRPFFALFLDVDPRHVDVNVSPSKTEVRFDDEGGVYAFLRAVVKRGLGAAHLALTWAPPGEAPGGPAPAHDDFESAGARARWGDPPPSQVPAPDAWGDGGWQPAAPHGEPEPRPALPIPSRAEPLGDSVAGDDDAGGSIWPLHGRYLLTAIRSGLLVVDHQAAHVRVLYERALTALAGGLAASQQLLFPHGVELGPAEHAALKELLPDLRALGFALDIGAGRTVVVRGLPADVRLGSEARVLEDVLAGAADAGADAADRRARLARAFARRSAIRSGDALKPDEARTLIDQLFACDEPWIDPDGRPTMVRVSLDELGQRFGR